MKHKEKPKDKEKKKLKLIGKSAAINAIDHSEEIKRLNRITGQTEGISKMLAGSRKLDEVLVQFKAVHSALRAVEMQVVRSHLTQMLDDVASMDKKKNREQKLAELEHIFKHSA
jgi:DNA-binding FrmR family transcriptional regulator